MLPTEDEISHSQPRTEGVEFAEAQPVETVQKVEPLPLSRLLTVLSAHYEPVSEMQPVDLETGNIHSKSISSHPTSPKPNDDVVSVLDTEVGDYFTCVDGYDSDATNFRSCLASPYNTGSPNSLSDAGDGEYTRAPSLLLSDGETEDEIESIAAPVLEHSVVNGTDFSNAKALKKRKDITDPELVMVAGAKGMPIPRDSADSPKQSQFDEPPGLPYSTRGDDSEPVVHVVNSSTSDPPYLECGCLQKPPRCNQ